LSKPRPGRRTPRRSPGGVGHSRRGGGGPRCGPVGRRRCSSARTARRRDSAIPLPRCRKPEAQAAASASGPRIPGRPPACRDAPEDARRGGGAGAPRGNLQQDRTRCRTRPTG
jgi:hypothetical protein